MHLHGFYISLFWLSLLLLLSLAYFDSRRKLQKKDLELQKIKFELEALTKSEALLKEAQALTGVGSYEIDIKSQKSFWSEQAAKNFGLSPDADMNKADWAALIHPDDKPKVDRLWQAAVESCSTFDCEYRILRAKGEVAYMHGVGRPIIDEIGQPVKFVGTIRDVTGSTLMKIMLKEQEAKALQSERMAYFGKIAGAVAHEINNPLAIIQSAIQLLQRRILNGQMSPDFFVKTSKQMEHAAQRISRIIKSIQSCSTDSSDEAFVLTDLTEVVKASAQIFSSLVRAQPITFKTTFSMQKNINIVCQPTEIAQALLNILMNAKDAVPETKDAEICLEANILDDHVLIRISNNGPRIAHEHREKIWQPFYSTKDEKMFLGLGLCASKAIIERHTGTIWLDNDREDTTFVIWFPANCTILTQKKLLAAE